MHHGRLLGPTEYKDVARLPRAPQAGSPQIVVPTMLKRAVVLGACQRHGLGISSVRGDVGAAANLAARVRDSTGIVGRGEKMGFQIEQRD